MAFTGGRFFCEMTWIDSGNNTSRTTFEVAGADISAAETNAGNIVPDFIAMSDAYCVSYSVREQFSNGALRSPAGEVEEKAVITVNLATAPKKGLLTIPAPKDTIFAGAAGTDNYNNVDGADSLVTTLIGDFQTGGGGLLSDGELVAASGPFVKGRRTHRNSSRG